MANQKHEQFVSLDWLEDKFSIELRPGMVIVDDISEEERTILLDCAKEAIDYNWQLVDEIEAETLKKLEEEGVQVNEVDAEERHKMGDTMNERTKGDIVSLCGEEIYNTLMEAVEEQRDK